MICQNCGKNIAQLHSITNINGQITDRHLCLDCAQQVAGATLSIGDFIAGVMGETFGLPSESAGRAERALLRVCPKCGIEQNEMLKRGRVGCASCYTAFADVLGPMLQRIHGRAQHAGKAPQPGASHSESPAWDGEAAELCGGKDAQPKDSVDALRAELDEAIRGERFERAAELRDRIKLLLAAEKEG